MPPDLVESTFRTGHGIDRTESHSVPGKLPRVSRHMRVVQRAAVVGRFRTASTFARIALCQRCGGIVNPAGNGLSRTKPFWSPTVKMVWASRLSVSPAYRVSPSRRTALTQ